MWSLFINRSKSACQQHYLPCLNTVSVRMCKVSVYMTKTRSLLFGCTTRVTVVLLKHVVSGNCDNFGTVNVSRRELFFFHIFTFLLLTIFSGFLVRLHDSISEEGFHYLVFDLWVYCLSFPLLLLSPLSFLPFSLHSPRRSFLFFFSFIPPHAPRFSFHTHHCVSYPLPQVFTHANTHTMSPFHPACSVIG